jgi:hypothetical protein
MATAYPGGLRKRGGLLDYEDTIQATPRNAFFGGVADLLGQAYKLPEMPRLGVPGLDFVAANRNRLMDLLDIGSVQKTAEGMAYGNRLGTGRGMTYRPLPETVGAALTVAPMVAPAARMMGEGAMATGRFVAPKAGLLAENYMADMGFMPTMAERVGKLNASEVLFPGRTQASLSSAEKTALTKYKKSLDVPAVMRRERLALEGGGNIVEPTPGETFREGLGIEPTYLLD